MKNPKSPSKLFLIVFLVSICFTSCLTSRKFDAFVGEQYNNQVTKIDKRKKSDIIITSAYTPASEDISNTVTKTSKFLPLLVYWSFDYRHTCTLNPLIAVNSFTNTVNTMAAKTLESKLEGKKLELKVEQVPLSFALVDKAHMIFLLVYAITWDKIYMEPDFKDLVVSYTLSENGQVAKTGKITMKGTADKKGLRYFQSWKSAISEYLVEYNLGITNLSRSFMVRLAEEL